MMQLYNHIGKKINCKGKIESLIKNDAGNAIHICFEKIEFIKSEEVINAKLCYDLGTRFNKTDFNEGDEVEFYAWLKSPQISEYEYSLSNISRIKIIKQYDEVDLF